MAAVILRNRAAPAVGGAAPAHAVHACPQVGAEAPPRDRTLAHARTRMYTRTDAGSASRALFCVVLH